MRGCGVHVALDRELARKRYLDLRARLDEAMLAAEREKRRLSPSIDLLDPANLPETPDHSRIPIIAGSTFAGLLAGLLFFPALRLHRSHPHPDCPESTPAVA